VHSIRHGYAKGEEEQIKKREILEREQNK